MARISHENVDHYQAEFDAIVLDFYETVDEIEKKTDELLEEARDKTVEEGRKLVQRLNSLNLRFSQRLSSPLQPSVNDDARQPRAEDNAISRARFQSLTKKVQDGTATSNEGKEFLTLRREFFPEGTEGGR